MRASILTIDPPNATLAFAAEELQHFLGYIPQLHFVDAGQTSDWMFILATDPALPVSEFMVQTSVVHDGTEVRLVGANPTGVLHAVYTMLERVGFYFEITGPRWADNCQLENLLGWSERIQPAVLQRGIRQHINFPMDISSYSLDEAREYIRNLARLRLNHITFHSYPGQWYEVTLPNEMLLAGAFFYEQRHDIPDHPTLRQTVHNASTFCIPEIESYYDNPEKRSTLAVQWLQAVITEAKRVGLTVQFSFELRSPDRARSLLICQAILDTYPSIDILEIITQETAGWGEAVPVETLRAAAVESFGTAILEDPLVTPYLRSEQPGLDQLLRELGYAIEVLQALKTQHVRLPQLAVGIYCVVPGYVKLLLHLMRRFVPAGIGFALLVQHGNRAVVESLAYADMTSKDWARSMIYSWIEFDGTMYLQQNAVKGIHQLIRLGQTVNDSAPIYGICLNHWRTAENRTPARYAAMAFLDGSLEPETFYREYALSLGIAIIEKYQYVMSLLDDADAQARDELLNIGFCFVGVWGDEGLSYYGRFDARSVSDVRSKYETVQRALAECSQSTRDEAGRHYLSFLLNRLECTIQYLVGVEKAVELQSVCGNRLPDALTVDERQRVNRICEDALNYMEAYMALHAQAMPDRGCEGTLISFYYTPPAVLKRIQYEYGTSGTKPENERLLRDSPPAPMG